MLLNKYTQCYVRGPKSETSILFFENAARSLVVSFDRLRVAVLMPSQAGAQAFGCQGIH
jgi:hypothetical protein